MRAEALGEKGRWVVAAVGGVVVTVALFLLFRFPGATPLVVNMPRVPVAPVIRVAKPDDGDLLLQEEAQLRDLRPMFLPTSRNAALPEPRLEPGKTFLEDEHLKLNFSDAEVQISRELPPVAMLAGRRVEEAGPVDALSPQENGVRMQGFGRMEASTTPVKSRGGYLAVTALADGRRVLDATLPIEAQPAGESAWAPVEFMAVVDAAGLVSPLAVTEGSRVEDVDVHFKKYLTLNFRIGERLGPGLYRVVVAP
jgi:hypothetical protein